MRSALGRRMLVMSREFSLLRLQIAIPTDLALSEESLGSCEPAFVVSVVATRMIPLPVGDLRDQRLPKFIPAQGSPIAKGMNQTEGPALPRRFKEKLAVRARRRFRAFPK